MSEFKNPPVRPESANTNTANCNPKQVFEHLQADTSTCSALVELLQQEATALKERHYDQLAEISSSKAPLLITLEKNSQVRQQWLQHYRQTHPQADWLEFLNHLAGSYLTDAWNQLETLFKECQRLNTTNGRLIAKSRMSVNHLLDIIRGLHNTPKLYNQAGKTRSQTSTRPFVKA